MRSLFPKLVKSYLDKNYDLYVLLGDIGVYSFRDIFSEYPDNIENIGLVEQSMIGIAAGLSIGGHIPIVHTITPFLVERAYEQLKIDFGYQNIGGNFISVGGAYDYSGLGSTHHCPSDVRLIKSIPNFQCILPGNKNEFETLFNQTVLNNSPTYFRLSETPNNHKVKIDFGKANLIRKDGDLVIIVVGDMLDETLKATKNLPVTILYYTTLEPFDREILKKYVKNQVLIIGAFYEGTLVDEVILSQKGKKIQIEVLGVPNKFIHNYGSKKEISESVGLLSKNIKSKVKSLINLK